MTHSRSRWFVLAFAATFVACGRDGKIPSASVNTGPVETPIGPVDTSGHSFPSSFDLSGRVLAMSANSGAMGSDTITYSPIGGVELKLYHNVLVDSAASQVLAGVTTSATDGSYHFSGVPGGYYVLYAYPSAASGYDGAYSLVPGIDPTVSIDVYVWKKK
jgi:hypothetical protein